MTSANLIANTTRRTASVLLVEDDEAILEGIADLLEFSSEQFDIQVSKALNGQLGLDAMETALPDLVISDVSMPVMDGYAFLSAVRSNPNWAHIPFVLLTAQASAREISNGLAQGVELYLTKPFDSMQLIELVETHLNKALQQREVRESRETQMRRALSRTLQHELRTPLALVTAYLEFIDMSIGAEFGDMPPDADELQEYLRGIDVGIRRLTRLVSDIIAAIDMRSGRSLKRIRAEAAYFNDIEAMLQEALAEARSIGDSDHATVELVLPDEMDTLFGQRWMLKDAFARLFHNAFKFTKLAGRGQVQLKVSQLSSAEAAEALGYHPHGASGALHFELSDDGIGFPNHARYKLVELFHQYDRDKWEQQGPGVGLNIVRGVTCGHNGRLNLDGTPGDGASVSMILPCYDDQSEAPELGTAPEPMRTVSILLVEDDAMVREVFVDLAEVLESEFHHDISLAENGIEALELLETTIPDLIVSDIRMPGMDGIEMLKQIRTQPQLSEIPVIFLTGNREPEQVHEGRKLGVDEYIPKPYTPEHLFARIDTLLKRSFEKQAAEASSFDVLKERVLSSIEIGVVASLRAMAQHSQTMRSVVENDTKIAASSDLDDLRSSLVGIQSNSSKISNMVSKATMLVDIRTGAAAATFELRSNMIESIGDLVASVVRDYLRAADSHETYGRLTVDFEREMLPMPLFGNSKMLMIAFENLLTFFDMKRRQAGGISFALTLNGDAPLLSAEFPSTLLEPDALQLLQSIMADPNASDANQAELAIFREYLRLHSATVSISGDQDRRRLGIQFMPFTMDAL